MAEPRVWDIPTDPGEDVHRVRDADGVLWERADCHCHWRAIGADLDDYFFAELVRDYSPITEAPRTGR